MRRRLSNIPTSYQRGRSRRRKGRKRRKKWKAEKVEQEEDEEDGTRIDGGALKGQRR